jgi:hypothetical protein
MTNLVDHYLLQLRSLLPAKSRDDVAAELGDSIRTSVADRERELGRTLTEDELAQVLKGYGHPMLVAGRYLPMQELISARMFPLYWYVLQAVVIVIAVVTGILAGIAFLTGARTGMQVIFDGFWFALAVSACVTIAFACIDRSSARIKIFENFDPRRFKLGVLGVRAAPLSPISRSDTVFEIATLVIFVAWWVGWVDFVNVVGAGIPIEFTARLEPFFWPLLVLAVVDLARLAVDFVYPYRTWPRVLSRLVINLAWLAAFVLAFRTDGLLTAVAGADVSTRAIEIAETSLRITLAVLALVSAALVATDGVRLARR